MKRVCKMLGLTLMVCCSHLHIAGADEVKIQVRDEAGKPIEGAKVWISSFVREGKVLVQTTDATGETRADLTADPNYKTILGRAAVLAPGMAIGGANLKAGENMVTLGKPRSLSGVVKDADGKPVEGALVRPGYLMKPGTGYEVIAIMGDTAEWADFFVRTDAAGRWTLPALPGNARVSYELNDDRYVRIRGDITLSSGSNAPTEAKPLVARPTATIVGRVLGTDGKPVVGLAISASDEARMSWGSGKTDVNGNYIIKKIGGGSFTLKYYRDKATDPPAAPVDVAVKEAETAHAPDMVQSEGVLVEGTVLDATTEKPLAGAMISVGGTSNTTGADGRFSVRTLAGKNDVYVMGLPEGYRYPQAGSPSGVLKLSVPDTGTKDLVFKLPVAEKLEGRVVDEAGAPAIGAKLMLTQRWDRLSALMGEDGSFSFKNLDPGEVPLAVEGDWALVKPEKVTVPQNQPVVVTVRRALLRPLEGRVIDSDHRPVSGAEVSIDVMVRMGSSSSTSTREVLTTDADGRFRLPKARPEHTYTVTTKKAGYRFLSGGKVSVNKEIMAISGQMIPNPSPNFVVEDIVLQELSQSLSGAVQDEAGKPISGAEIFAAGGETVARSDAEGKFTIAALPPGDTNVFAARGKLFGRARSAGGAVPPVTLRALQSGPPTREAGLQLLKDALGGPETYYAETALSMLAVSDPDTALKMVATLKADQQARAGTLALAALAKLDPKKARERIPDLLGALPKPPTGQEAVQLANLIAEYEPDETRAIYDREKAALKPLPAKLTQRELYLVWPQLMLGTLGVQLKADGAEKLIDDAVAVSLRATNGPDEFYANDLPSSAVVPGGTALVERVTALLPADKRAGALARALPALAKRDLAGAMRLLETVSTLPQPVGARSMDSDPENAFGKGAIAIIGELGKTDPAAALALARRVTSERYKATALATAAVFQPKESAVALLREAFAVKMPYADPTFRLAVVQKALLVDEALAGEFLKEIESQILLNETDDRYYRGGRQIEAGLAYLLAPVAPGHARFLLERAALRINKTSSWERTPIILAMARVDFARAEEMVRTFGGADEADGPPTGQANSYMLGLLAQYALMPQELRDTVPLNRLQGGSFLYEDENF